MIRTTTRSFKTTRTLILSGLVVAGMVGNTAVKTFAASGTFALTGSLNTARWGHTATLLPSGEVLVAGGFGTAGEGNPIAGAELYNPATGKWTATGSMSSARVFFTATLLSTGEVLAAGGQNSLDCQATAELYNPSTGKWTLTGSMTQPRCSHAAALLPSGEVLAAGGGSDSLASAELYNPSTGEWSASGSMNVGRTGEAIGLLQNGEVLVAGGSSLASAELYDPSTGMWSLTASMTKADVSPTPLVLLANALVANNEQFYNPATAAWTLTGAFPAHTAGPPELATLLNTGNVLGSGTHCDYSGCGSAITSTCFLSATASNSWSVTGSMNDKRIYHTSTLLLSGKVLVAGGYAGVGDPLTSAELYTP
jgi:galactose oxidase-like protein/Kelch motif protein